MPPSEISPSAPPLFGTDLTLNLFWLCGFHLTPDVAGSPGGPEFGLEKIAPFMYPTTTYFKSSPSRRKYRFFLSNTPTRQGFCHILSDSPVYFYFPVGPLSSGLRPLATSPDPVLERRSDCQGNWVVPFTVHGAREIGTFRPDKFFSYAQSS